MRIKIGHHSQIWLGCRFIGDNIHEVEIGNYSALASDVVINAAAPIIIGDHVRISQGVEIITATHDCKDPAFAPLKSGVTIHSHAWIATRAIILRGVIIGEGAVVGAGSVVSQEIKPMGMVAGNPARCFGTRSHFTPEESPNDRPPLFC